MLLMPSYRPRVVAAAEDAIEFVMPAAASTLTDYIGYIDFADTTIQASSGFLSKLISGSGNIRIFASDKTTEWTRHVNVVSGNTGGQVWFKVPSYVSSGTTTFYMWADTGKVADYLVTDTFGRNNTFNSVFRAFWGMDADPSSGSLTDWTGNGNNLTIENMVAGDQITLSNGMYAYEFDGGVSSNRMYVDTPTFAGDTLGTVSGFFKIGALRTTNGTNVFWGLGGSGDTANPGVILGEKRRNAGFTNSTASHISTTHRIEGSGTVNGVGEEENLSANTEEYLAWRSSGAAWSWFRTGALGTEDVWVGSNTGDWFGDANPSGTDRFAVGNVFSDGSWGTTYSDDIIGPFGVKNTESSVDLMVSERLNQRNPATFYDSITEVTF